MKKKTVFYRGLTALVISAMLVTVPAVSNVAYADSVNVEDAAEQQTEAANEDGTGEPETEASTEPETETAEEDGTKEPETKAPTEPETEAPKAEDNKEPETETPKEQKTETPKEQDSEDAAAEFEANIAKLKAYEEKLKSLTSEDAATIKELLNAVSDYLDANEDVELSDENNALLGTIAEKLMLNSASIMTVDVATPTEAEKSINEQIKEGTDKPKTIKVTADIAEDVVIPKGYDITLEIANGVTLTNDDDHTVTVQDGGTLTIEGKGTIDNITNQKAALDVEEGGVAVIDGGIFARSKETGKSPKEGGENTFYIIRNHGKLTINDATVKSDGHYSSLIANGYQKTTKTKNRPTLTINGGTFNGGINTIKNDQYGILYITDGDFDNMTQYAVQSWNKAEISGGTFANIVWNGWYSDDDSLGLMTITGGTFKDEVRNGNYENKTSKGGTMTITGGTFEKEIRSQKVTKLTVEKLDGTPTISVDKDVAKDNLSITAKPEKESDGVYNYTFLGWFDQNGDAPGTYGTLKDDATEYVYTPTYLSSKIVTKDESKDESTDSSIDTEEAKATTETLNKDAMTIINNILTESSSEDKGYEVEDGVTAETIKEALANEKASIVTKVELEPVESNTVSTEVVEKFNKAAAAEDNSASASTSKNTWKLAPGSFVNIDISMYVTYEDNTDDKKLAKLTQLNNEIKLSITIPEAQRSKNNKYAVARYHDGEVEILDATKSSDGKSVVFSSNLFSYYALIYKEANNIHTSSGNRSSESTATSSTVSNGTWMMDNVGWWFKKADGSYPKDTWYECTWNGVSNWYHFNAQGYADGGWLTDKDGQKYYLHNAHDGKFGFMYTGWNKIADQWYYFNTNSVAAGLASGAHSKGSLVTNATTADGYKVGADGAWIK